MKLQLTLKEAAELTKSRLIGDPLFLIEGIAKLDEATSKDVVFFANPKFTSNKFDKALEDSQAGVIILSEESLKLCQKNTHFLVNENPSLAFQTLLDHTQKELKPSGFEGIHPTAVIHPTTVIGDNVTILPYAVIDAHVSIASGSFIGSHVYIGPHSKIGYNTIIHSGSIIREFSQIHDRVILQPNSVIGSCGFGYDTNARGEHTKLGQVGSVIIENDVEIGACTTVDRARLGHTIVGKGSKIDNLVQIAHGVKLGSSNLIAAQTGIAGSSKTGHCVIMGGQSAMVGHVEVCSGTIFAARSGVSKNITKPGTYAGVPARPIMEYRKQESYSRNMEKYVQRIKDLEKKCATHEDSSS